ncbi:MAG TPA: glutathione S-transferase C-terminal domain-containing protein [Candidatus Binatia bacterium]|nr:glutathione S-transferase C-terminal domain-containing protein [Candidatus Binatia bacterium]
MSGHAPSCGCRAAARDARTAVQAHMDVVERRLEGRDWLIDDYSLADICYAPLVTVFHRVALGDLIDTRPAVAAWVERLRTRPAVRDTEPPPMRVSLPQ